MTLGAILVSLVLAASGVPRVTDAQLSAVAEQRVAELTEAYAADPKALLAHRSLPELDNGRWQQWGEVLAYRSGDATPLPEIVAGWMGSPDHAEILRAPRYDAIGCAAAWSGVRLYAVCILADTAGSTSPPAPAPESPSTIADTAVAHP